MNRPPRGLGGPAVVRPGSNPSFLSCSGSPGRRPSAWLLTFLLAAGCLDVAGPTGQPEAPGVPRLVVPAVGQYTQLSATYTYTCALRTDGVINCWGRELVGEAPATRSTPGGYTAVAVKRNHSCGLRTDGVVECWGANTYDQAPPVVTPPAGTVYTAITLGEFFTCALRADGIIDCWGQDASGTVGSRASVTGSPFTQISASNYYVCGLSSTGVSECWGEGPTDDTDPPAEFHATVGTFSRVIGAGGQTCGMRTDGVIECTDQAEDYDGQPFVDFGVHWLNQHWCGVRADGVIVCGGDDEFGEAPETRTAATGKFVKVAVGVSHSCALRDDGRIECWGRPDYGAYDHIDPEATFHAPASVIVGQPIELLLSDAHVPGFPSTTSFLFAFDCGTGFGSPGTTASTSCPTDATGVRSVGGRVIDMDADYSTYTAEVAILTVEEGTADLIDQIDEASLSPDLRKALRAKLNAALSALDKGRTAAACSALQDFINQLNAQRGKAIPEDVADAWIATATQLRAAIGC